MTDPRRALEPAFKLEPAPVSVGDAVPPLRIVSYESRWGYKVDTNVVVAAASLPAGPVLEAESELESEPESDLDPVWVGAEVMEVEVGRAIRR